MNEKTVTKQQVIAALDSVIPEGLEFRKLSIVEKLFPPEKWVPKPGEWFTVTSHGNDGINCVRVSSDFDKQLQRIYPHGRQGTFLAITSDGSLHSYHPTDGWNFVPMEASFIREEGWRVSYGRGL